jgi:myo-inositol 2-dehydrogenase/D-chiro-inositol 1-dehydrogenase
MTIRVGIIGTGSFARVHGQILSKLEEVTVTAICGTSQAKAEKFASEWDQAKSYGNIEHMLDSEKLDAIYICVPPFAHGELEQSIIEREIPFFIEKPIGTEMNVPLDILSNVVSKNLITSVGYHFRYSDGTLRLKEQLQNRQLAMANGYYMGSMPKVAWWRNEKLSGGQFIEQTTHIVDLLRYTVGEVKEVYAAYAQQVMRQIDNHITVPDVGSVTFKLENGAIATISNTCALPEGYKVGLNLFTDRGVLEWSPQGLKDLQQNQIVETKNKSNPYELENRAFIHAVRTGDRSGILSDYADACKSQFITVTAAKSAKLGLPIQIEDLKKH